MDHRRTAPRRDAALDVRVIGDELVVHEPDSDRAHVLDGPTAREFLELDTAGTARRDMLRKLGVTAAVGAVALPGIQSIVMPSVAAAQSGDGGGGEGPDPDPDPGGGTGTQIVGVVTTFAGGAPGYVDGSLADARFEEPSGLAVAPDGTIYVSDAANNRIRRISPGGQVTTYAGTEPTTWSPDGPVGTAWFSTPNGIALAPDGTLFVADLWNQRIRRISPDGVVTSVTGPGELFHPVGVLIGPGGVLYVSDAYHQQIFRVAPDGAVTRIAGNGGSGFADGLDGEASFHNPWSMVLLPGGDLAVADAFNRRIRRVTMSGTVTTMAGNGGDPIIALDGPPAVNKLLQPEGIVRAPNGTLYIADARANSIRALLPSGELVTIAGGSEGSADGTGAAAQFDRPSGIAFAPDGSLIVAERGGRIRRVS